MGLPRNLNLNKLHLIVIINKEIVENRYCLCSELLLLLLLLIAIVCVQNGGILLEMN